MTVADCCASAVFNRRSAPVCDAQLWRRQRRACRGHPQLECHFHTYSSRAGGCARQERHWAGHCKAGGSWMHADALHCHIVASAALRCSNSHLWPCSVHQAVFKSQASQTASSERSMFDSDLAGSDVLHYMLPALCWPWSCIGILGERVHDH